MAGPQLDPQLSPPSASCGGLYGETPSPPCRVFCTNNVWLESPESSAEPSPLRLPFKSLRVAAGTSTLSGDTDSGHLVISMGQADEADSLSCASSPGSQAGPKDKWCLALGGAPELAVPHSPRIPAHHSLVGEQHPQQQQQHPKQQQELAPEASAASDGLSYIEWSLSTASLGQQPSGPPQAERGAEVSSYFHAASHSSYSLPAASAAAADGSMSYCGTSYSGEEGEDEEEAGLTDDGSSMGLPTRGHIIARAANVRYLWSPFSTEASGTASEARSSLRSSPGRGSIHGQNATDALAGSPSLPHDAQHTTTEGRGSPTAEGSPSSQQWIASSSSSRWGQEHHHHHPIFGLQGVGEALPTSAAAAPTSAARQEAAVEEVGGEDRASARIASRAPSPANSRAPSPGASPALPAPPQAGAMPQSPSLPPLQQSAWSPPLPPPSSHRRYHSAVPLQAASSGSWAVAVEGSGLERAWSISGSHIDIKLGTPGASLASLALGSHAATPHDELALRELLFSPRGRIAGAWVPSPAASSTPTEPPHVIGLAPGSYAAAFQRCKKLDISRVRRHVLSSPTRKPARAAPLLERLAAGCLNPAAGRLRWRLGRQRVRLLSLGKLPYDADQPLHYILMQATVSGFAGRRPAGDGWREVGFTSANPSATDLIGCGVLGLLHLVLLLEKRPHIATELHRAQAQAQQPQEEEQHQRVPPISAALLSVHVTLWTLQALKGGLMSRAAKRLRSTTTAAECFYLGAMECLVEQWKEAGGQLQHWQEALHRAEQRAKSNVWPMIQRTLTQSD